LKKKLPFAFIIFLLFHTALSGQQYYFKHYQVENGLSNNTVRCSLQDKDGFLWFGTLNGLNRFDGYSFKVFRNNPEDSTSIGTNFIICLYADENKTLWIGTNKGVYRYNETGEKFTLVKALPLENINAIQADKKGKLWVMSNADLYSYDPASEKAKAYTPDNIPGVVSSLSITPDSSLWISTSTGLLKKYMPQTDSFMTYEVYEKKGKPVRFLIEKIYPVSNQTFLIGTINQGVKFYDANTKECREVVTYNPDKTEIYAREFIRQSENEYWIGTETGVVIYDVEKNTVKQLKKQYDDPYSLSDNVIYTFCKDREGGLWIGTFFGGLNYYPKQYTAFEKFFPEYSVPSISGNAIHEICKDRYGNLWVGTEDAGLNKIDLQKRTFSYFKPTGAAGSVTYHNIHGLLATGNELWIGTFEHGLDVMDIRTGKVIRHYSAGPDSNSFKGNFIITIYQMRSSDLLIGTWKGLFKYNRITDNFSPFAFFNSEIQALLEDDEGTLWACTLGNGVLYYNPKTLQKGNLQYEAGNSNSLSNNHVNGVFEDSRKNLWFATEGGLCKYDRYKKVFTRYTTKNGLPDNLIFRILEDDSKKLWISTSKGLVCFDPDAESMRTYTQSNGLLSDQFNYNSSFKDADGRMFFGSVKGLISFNPAEFIKNTSTPPVYITGFQVNNKELTVNNTKSPLKESITYTRSITLPYDQSTFSIDFAALSYTVPEMNEYSYRMVGLDKDWTYLKSNRKAYFTKLSPGKYTFKVKGSNSSGVWNEKEAALEINISPPFWASIWAYIFYASLCISIAYILIRNYLARAEEKNRRKIEVLEMEKEREIYHAKIEFFTNVAHEIRTPLTLIKMPLDKLIKKENNNIEINDNLKMMEKNTNRLIDLTNQLLDFRKTETDKFSLNFVKTDISDLLRETYSGFKPAAEQKNLNFKMELPGLSLQAYVDPEALKKILSNLFNNAIKYAETEVFARLRPFSSEDKFFTIEIKNDGYVIPYDQKEKIFEPFYRIKETEKQPGTGIGLPLSRSLAELHKGVLDLKHSENKLNIFVLTLPMHQEKEFNLHNDEPAMQEAEESKPDKEENIHSTNPIILFVEDNKEILDFTCKELASDYTVYKALNGAEALEILKVENIQLVISDIMMPVMDGLELCKKIKTNLEYSHIPIILLTAKNTLHSKIEGLEVGADAYIEKPFSFEHLQAQISNLLSNRNKIKEYFASSPLVHIKSIGYSKTDKNFLEKLNAVIDENLTTTDIDVEHLAKIMNMSRPTFYRKIKALSNLTPHELINIAKLKKAAALLAEGNYRVYEVASMIGYSLQTNFARDFHKQFGMTPTEYMNNRQSEKNMAK